MMISKYITKFTATLLLFTAVPLAVLAGNPDRAGSAGASHLLINPWARGSGMSNSNMASVRGIEATWQNVAGLAFVDRTELTFTNTQYFVGTGISINSLGFAQKVGESGVLGISVMAMNFGDIDITTEDLPEGGVGSFSPSLANIGVSFAKAFSNSIFGGITMKVVSESITNVKAQGIAFDAGIRYISGDNDQLKFGISLRNVGPAMRYSGDGLAITSTIQNSTSTLTTNQRSDLYELPSQLNIGVAYDFLLSEDMQLTANGQFISNSFSLDQYAFGGELDWKQKVIIRAGYQWETGLGNEDDVATAVTGLAAGLSIQVPTGSSGSVIGLDYAYKTTNPFGGIHSIGVHLSL
ncbi:MAG: hypothetical protein ACJAU0_000239 [Flavobacteriales bacterium]|jgi:hypothetical protein